MSEKTLGESRMRFEHRELTPEEIEFINQVKRKTAELIDMVNRVALNPDWEDSKIGEFKRLKSLAMTDFESAAGWAVKAATA